MTDKYESDDEMNRVGLLLHIIEHSRQHPKLGNITRLALEELQDINDSISFEPAVPEVPIMVKEPSVPIEPEGIRANPNSAAVRQPVLPKVPTTADNEADAVRRV